MSKIIIIMNMKILTLTKKSNYIILISFLKKFKNFFFGRYQICQKVRKGLFKHQQKYFNNNLYFVIYKKHCF